MTLQFAEVKEAAHGKWEPTILPAMLPSDMLTGKDANCAGCGGLFRLIKERQDGSFVCSGGDSETSGDGFALLQHVLGLSRDEAVHVAADELGIAESKSNGEGKEEQEKLPFTFGAALDTEVHQEFTIDEWIPRDSISVLYAPKDHLKSFVAVDMGMCVASGIPWKGRSVKQGAFVIVAGEGNKGLRKRLKAWTIHNGQDLSEIPVAVSTVPMQVLDEQNLIEWTKYLDALQARIGEFGLIVIDTLATNYGPGDENSTSDMARFLAMIKIAIQSRYNCAVLVVHHTGKDQSRGARGAYAIEANAEAVLDIRGSGGKDDDHSKLANDLRITLRCKHMKDAERPDNLPLIGRVVELGYKDKNGIDATSLVLDAEIDPDMEHVLADTLCGLGQRDIAAKRRLSRSTVQRIQKRLRNLGRLS